MLNSLLGLVGKSHPLRPQQLNIRLPLWHPDLPFVILWSEKAGCTTVVKWFFHQIGLLEEAERFNGWIHEYENKVFKLQPGYLDGCYRALQQGLPVYKFVRDPAARAFSGYLELCHPRILRGGPWRPLRLQVLTHLTGQQEPDIEMGFSFFDFVSWLETEDLNKVNGHFRPQQVVYERSLQVQALPIERLKDQFLMLEQRHNLRSHAGYERIYESHHHHRKQAAASGAELDRLLRLSIPLTRRKDFVIPKVDTAMLEGTETGQRLARLFDMDYRAYREYASPALRGARVNESAAPHLRRSTG